MNGHNYTSWDDYRQAIGKLTAWGESGEVFGCFNDIANKANADKSLPKIYELYCYVRILYIFRNNYTIRLVSDHIGGEKRLPGNPGLKENFAYFTINDIEDGNIKFQICFGTKIKLGYAPLTTVAPDISIQKSDACLDPDHNMVCLIMDAKYKFRKSIDIEILHGFAQRVRALNTENATNLDINFDTCPHLKANCLLTNRNVMQDHEEYCVHFRIKQVEYF